MRTEIIKGTTLRRLHSRMVKLENIGYTAHIESAYGKRWLVMKDMSLTGEQ